MLPTKTSLLFSSYFTFVSVTVSKAHRLINTQTIYNNPCIGKMGRKPLPSAPVQVWPLTKAFIRFCQCNFNILLHKLLTALGYQAECHLRQQSISQIFCHYRGRQQLSVRERESSRDVHILTRRLPFGFHHTTTSEIFL
jgi:hypothetical protein